MDHFVCLVPIVFELIFHVLLLHALVRAFRAIINNKANKIAVLTLLVFWGILRVYLFRLALVVLRTIRAEVCLHLQVLAHLLLVELPLFLFTGFLTFVFLFASCHKVRQGDWAFVMLRSFFRLIFFRLTYLNREFSCRFQRSFLFVPSDIVSF
jgi:hypothetical protein